MELGTQMAGFSAKQFDVPPGNTAGTSHWQFATSYFHKRSSSCASRGVTPPTNPKKKPRVSIVTLDLLGYYVAVYIVINVLHEF